MYASVCGLIQFTYNSINGYTTNDTPKWAGYQNLKEIFEQTITAIDDLNNNYDNMFLHYDNILTHDQDYLNSISTYSTTYGEKTIKSPNPDTTDRIITIYQKLYAPYTSKTTLLGEIYSKYTNSLNKIIKTMIKIKNDIDTIKTNSNDIKNLLTSINSEYDKLIILYQNIEEHLVDNYLKVKDIIISKLGLATKIIYFITICVTILCIVLNSVYTCKVSNNVRKIRKIIHVLWNLLLGVIILFFLLSGFFGIIMVLGRELVPIFNYLISEEYFENNTLFGALQANTIKYFHICINDEETDIANSFSLRTSVFAQIDSLYQNYNLLKNYTESLSQYEEDVAYFEEYNNKLKQYFDDIALSTTYEDYGVNDVTYNLEEFTRWTDYTVEDAIQTECGLGTKDQWVGNIAYCKTDYIYSLTGTYSKNCLKISDWRSETVTKRYLAACLSIFGNTVNTGISKYYGTINKYNNDNINLINKMTKGNDYLKALYETLLQEIKDEVTLNKQVLDEFVEPYTKYNSVNETENLYEMFNCSIIKNDLIGFYDKLYLDFYKFSLVQLSITLIIAILLYMSVYFVIRSIYRAENSIHEKSKSPSSSILDSDRKTQKEKEDEAHKLPANLVLNDNKSVNEDNKKNPMGLIYDENEIKSGTSKSNSSGSQNVSSSDMSGDNNLDLINMNRGTASSNNNLINPSPKIQL